MKINLQRLTKKGAVLHLSFLAVYPDKDTTSHLVRNLLLNAQDVCQNQERNLVQVDRRVYNLLTALFSLTLLVEVDVASHYIVLNRVEVKLSQEISVPLVLCIVLYEVLKVNLAKVFNLHKLLNGATIELQAIVNYVIHIIHVFTYS